METYKGDAYCVNCKEKVDFVGNVKVSDSGRRMAYGTCPKCGTKVNRILGKVQDWQTKQSVPEPQSAVTPIPVYATITISHENLWRAFVRDKRQGSIWFSARTKRGVKKKAMKYINSYEEIKLYEF